MTPTAQAPADFVSCQYALGRSLARPPLSHPRQLRTLLASLRRRLRSYFRSPVVATTPGLNPQHVHLPIITNLNQRPLRLPL